jgi:uncharacterized protein (UPF0276 family)
MAIDSDVNDWSMALQGPVKLGLAFSAYVPTFISQLGSLIDYVEISHELLMHQPDVIPKTNTKPIILHCASLSLAGTVKTSMKSIDQILTSIKQTRTPWLGEHLSFISAENIQNSDQIYEMGYTASPPLSLESLEIIHQRINFIKNYITVPIILENPPLYFVPPGSTMNQVEFISQFCALSGSNLLLDISHFYITCQTMGWSPIKAVSELPLDRVVEVHISGIQRQGDGVWDDHASFPTDECIQLLIHVLRYCKPKAITLEYNWPTNIHYGQLEGVLSDLRLLLPRE